VGVFGRCGWVWVGRVCERERALMCVLERERVKGCRWVGWWVGLGGVGGCGWDGCVRERGRLRVCWRESE